MNFLELYEINERIIKLRQASDILFDEKIISKEIKCDMDEKISLLEKENYCFITKPFLTCDSMGKTLYHFMKSLQRKKYEIK